jgi:hypothetical protein
MPDITDLSGGDVPVQGASFSAEPVGGASGGCTVVTVPSPHMIITQAGIACPRAAAGHGDACSMP